MGAFRSGMKGNIKLCATSMSLCAISKMLTRVCTALVSPPELKQGSRLSTLQLLFAVKNDKNMIGVKILLQFINK